MMLGYLKRLNEILTEYLKQYNDSEEVILQKQIWWLCNVLGLPFLIAMSLLLWDKNGKSVLIVNGIFFSLMFLSLIAFHFYKKSIQNFAFFTQLVIVLLAGVKVSLLGGLANAGGVVFIGMIAPLYALTLPNKKRAVFLYALYLVLMFGSYAFIKGTNITYFEYYTFLGFFLGVSIAFIGLLYYTTQVEKLKLIEKKRMEELDKFKTEVINNITHEFRTPLTVIIGTIEKLSKGKLIREAGSLEVLSRNAKNLLELTNQMLDLSKLKAKAMPVHCVQDDFIGYLNYLIDPFYSLAEEKGLFLKVHFTVPSLVMDFDPSKMKDIVSNIISNAIKFTPTGGVVSISVETMQKRQVPCVKIQVKDNGIGIPEDDLSKIFDKYFQVDYITGNGVKGSGIGLTITKQLVELLGGIIEVKSVLNKGSVFSVYLKIENNSELKKVEYGNLEINENSDLDKENISKISSHKNSDTLKLLIVEDNDDLNSYLYSMLSEKFEIIIAENGFDGYQKCLVEIPDLVISDVMMPEMDGFEMCQKIKDDIRTSHIPIILLTAKVDEVSKLLGLELGVDSYITKPFNFKELEIKINNLIELREQLHNRYKDESLNLILNLDQHESTNKEDVFIGKVNCVLREHLCDEDFGIENLCASLGMSRSQLYRKFSAITNTTVHQYMRKLRLLKGQSLLMHSELNVSEIAYETGFKSLSHFSTAYSDEFGIAPSKVKSKCQ